MKNIFKTLWSLNFSDFGEKLKQLKSQIFIQNKSFRALRTIIDQFSIWKLHTVLYWNHTYHSCDRCWSCISVEVCGSTHCFLLDHLASRWRLRDSISNRSRGTSRHHIVCWVRSMTSSSRSRRCMRSYFGGMKRRRSCWQWHSLKKHKKIFLIKSVMKKWQFGKKTQPSLPRIFYTGEMLKDCYICVKS